MPMSGAKLIVIMFLLTPIPAQAENASPCPSEEHNGAGPRFECPTTDEEELLPTILAPDALPARAGTVLEVPWDGALVHRDHLARVRARVLVLRRLRWLDRQTWLEERDLELHALARVHQAQIAASNLATNQLKEELKEERAKYRRRIWLFSTVGAVAAISLLASILTFYAAGGVL